MDLALDQIVCRCLTGLTMRRHMLRCETRGRTKTIIGHVGEREIPDAVSVISNCFGAAEGSENSEEEGWGEGEWSIPAD